MARPLRVEYSGALYHVMSRGNERRPIVRDDTDRRKRLHWLQRTVETYSWRLHAFVVMTNHEHLFIETPQPNLSAGMQFLNGSYTGYFNKRRRRSGHLFQGRFKAHLVEEQGHFSELSRYIHLNPVRAKMVEKPEAYRWSSYPGYHRKDRIVPWVTYDHVLGEFGKRQAASRVAYRRFVRAGLDERVDSPIANARHGTVIGSGDFVAKIRQMLKGLPQDVQIPQLLHMQRERPELDRIVLAVQNAFKLPPDSWKNRGRVDDASRAVAAYLGRNVYGYQRQEVAEQLGYRTGSSVTQAIRRFEASAQHLRSKVKIVQKTLEDIAISK